MRWNRLYQFAKTAFKVYQCDYTCPSSNSLNPSKTQHCVKIMDKRKTTTALIMDAVMSLNIDFPKNLGSIWVTREGIYVRLIHSDVFPSLKLSLVQGASIHYNKNEIRMKVWPFGGGLLASTSIYLKDKILAWIYAYPICHRSLLYYPSWSCLILKRVAFFSLVLLSWRGTNNPSWAQRAWFHLMLSDFVVCGYNHVYP